MIPAFYSDHQKHPYHRKKLFRSRSAKLIIEYRSYVARIGWIFFYNRISIFAISTFTTFCNAEATSPA